MFLDTPGIHAPRTKLGKRMVKTVADSVAEVDVAVMVFEPYGQFTPQEEELLADIRAKKMPAIGVVNKMDALRRPADGAARVAQLEALDAFARVLCVSAREGDGCEALLAAIEAYAIESPHYFPDDAYTDMPEKALVAEVVREKMLLFLYDEIPHGTAVTVERFKERPGQDLVDIDVNIYCEKKSHKGITIGKGGAMLKKIASAARLECEDFLGTRVNLQCWVKIKDDWRDSDVLLNNLGFRQN